MWKFIDKTSDFIFSDTFETIMTGICLGFLLVIVLYQFADKLSK